MAQLTFYGATQQVTGSCYLLQTDRSQVLLECGMYQGHFQLEKQNREPFPFEIKGLDAVVISHSHLDHCGLLPKLVKAGYQGPIYMTPAAHDLMEVMLKDAAHIEQKDTEWENRQRERSGKDPVEPLFTHEDVDDTLLAREQLDYAQQLKITDDITLTYHDAGHILGSAIVEFKIMDKGTQKSLVFSGDLGNRKEALLRDPAILKQADVLLMESTYGDRNHRSLEDTLFELQDALNEAHRSGGNVLIPSFAVGRTQEILYWLGKFQQQGKLGQSQIFLDSPMAIAANEIYIRHLNLFNREELTGFMSAVRNKWQDWIPGLRYTHTPEESMRLNTITGGAIIIAGSGMCTGGRIRHHLKNNLWRQNCHVIIVGYQANGTPGRALVDGARNLSLFHHEIAVKAKIHTLGGFSAHADQSQLLDWAKHFAPSRPDLHLVHGETEKMLVLQEQFYQRYQWHANIPHPGQILTF